MINHSKTTYIHIKHKTDKTRELKITMDNKEIAPSAQTNFLGLEIQENLEWEAHTMKISKKINKGIFNLRNLSYKVSEPILKTTYYAHVHSHIQYQIIFWGNSKHAKKKISSKNRIKSNISYQEKRIM